MKNFNLGLCDHDTSTSRTDRRTDDLLWQYHFHTSLRCQTRRLDHLKVFGVTLDSSMTLVTQVTATVRACNFHLQALQLRALCPWWYTQRRLCHHWFAAGLLQLTVCHTDFQRLQSAECCCMTCLPSSTTSTSLSRPTKGSPLVTGAWQSRLQDRCPLLQSRQTVTTFVSYLYTATLAI